MPPETELAGLVTSGPSGVRSWYEKYRTGEMEIPRSWSLLTLAEAAIHRAQVDLSLDWLGVAVELLEDLARSKAGWEGESNILSAMHLRAYFIGRLGADPTNPLLDVRCLVEWFRSTVPLSLEEVKERAAHWKDLAVQEMRTLRDVKNKLAVFQGLAKLGFLAPYPDVQSWMSIRDQLP